MLILNQRASWCEVPGSQGVQLLLLPLRNDRRAVLLEQCVVQVPPPVDAKGKPTGKRTERFDNLRYSHLVGAECVRGWKNVGNLRDDGSVDQAPFTADAVEQLMSIDPVADFVLNTVTGLGIHLAAAEEAAGKDSARAPAG